MDVTVITEATGVARLHEEWRSLYAAVGRTPFENPDWHRVWWERIGYREGWAPHVITGRVNGRLTAVAPLAVLRSRGLRMLEWAGGRVFDYPDMLLSGEADAHPIWKTARESRHYDVARLRGVKPDATSRPALEAFARKVNEGSVAHAVQFAHASGEAWFQSLSKRARAKHRARVRQIEEAGPLAMTTAACPAEVTAMMGVLVGQKVAWSSARNVAHFATEEGVPEFLEGLALQAWAEGSLHLSMLTCGDQAISTHLGFTSDDGFYYYMPGYDIALAKLSPGKVHLTKLIMWALDNGCRRFDFLRGEADYKGSLGNEVRSLSDYIFSRGIVGGAAARLYVWRQNRRDATIGAEAVAAE